ncbi:hypothetical protein [uncultured Exiguobacterium sp.]|uniref:hypothetical protein n=1 Tax=uncultured Exiguobacterium sp. TaxID=202669 RepID=UPI0025CC787D|nr:hypothetical protein [uncultured Exiguobacterium sp.]
MGTLEERLKKHLDWKIETRKYDSPKEVYDEVVSVFKSLTSEFEKYSIDGDPLVSYKNSDEGMSANLYVDVALEGPHLRREVIFHPYTSGNSGEFTFILNFRIPDWDSKSAFKNIAKIIVKSNETDVEILADGEELEVVEIEKFTRKSLRGLIEDIVLYGIDENHY